jgi:hypothetical protein
MMQNNVPQRIQRVFIYFYSSLYHVPYAVIAAVATARAQQIR